MVLTVTVDMYSGRPNPQWILSAAESAHLLRMIAALPVAYGPIPEPPALGYRGFEILHDRVPRWLVRRQYILAAGAVQELLSDPSTSVERCLLTIAGKHLSESDRQFLASQAFR